MEKRRAIFPGTFDPFTIGHQSLVDRALTLVDEIVISIGINSAKKTYFSLEERVASIEQLYRSDPRVKVMLYDSLTVDFAKRIDARFIHNCKSEAGTRKDRLSAPLVECVQASR